ncbi:MAG: hypothetical protein IID40_06760 [Planctomycetes bacterium]|nr:hypothetical protein [Planctomycetota bacterium]
MGGSLQTRLAERFREGAELLIGLFPRRRRPGRSYVGLVQATPRVGQRAFTVLWNGLRQTLPRRLGKSWRW